MSYNPSVGRWMQQDPDGYVDKFNLYQFEDSNPIVGLDPTGFADQPTTQPTTQPTPPPATMTGVPLLGGTPKMQGGKGFVWPVAPRTFTPTSLPTLIPGPNGGPGTYFVWGNDTQTGELWEYGVTPPPPVYDPVAEAKAAADAKRVREESMAELLEMADLAQKWNNTSLSEWNHWGNQCSDQAAALRRYLAQYKQWKYWDLSKAPVQGSVGGLFYHNVVLLNPMNGNPLGETVIDGWHYFGGEDARRTCWMNLKEWQDFWTPNQDEWYYFGCK